MRVIEVTGKGTVVHWFQMKTFSNEVSGELCLVLRYLSGACTVVQCSVVSWSYSSEQCHCMHAWPEQQCRLCFLCVCSCRQQAHVTLLRASSPGGQGAGPGRPHPPCHPGKCVCMVLGLEEPCGEGETCLTCLCSS